MDEITLVYESLLKAHAERRPCALATVVGTTGSIPRAMGAKMLIYPDKRIVGSVGGGKFESLVIDDALQALGAGDTVFKSYPLHEGDSHSFGAICGGDVRILIEPQRLREALVLIGAGHCSRAIASLAVQCGLAVTVVDDRAELLADFPATHLVNDRPPGVFIGGREWHSDEALVLVSRSFAIDREALGAALQNPGAGYVGMIGSRKKIRQVFSDLEKEGASREAFDQVRAPIGLDIRADSPAEIAVSVIAEVLSVLRGGTGCPLTDRNR